MRSAAERGSVTEKSSGRPASRPAKAAAKADVDSARAAGVLTAVFAVTSAAVSGAFLWAGFHGDPLIDFTDWRNVIAVVFWMILAGAFGLTARSVQPFGRTSVVVASLAVSAAALVMALLRLWDVFGSMPVSGRWPLLLVSVALLGYGVIASTLLLQWSAVFACIAGLLGGIYSAVPDIVPYANFGWLAALLIYGAVAAATAGRSGGVARAGRN
jgi:hypothetical protein